MAQITLKYQKNQSHEIRVEDLKIEKDNNKWTVKEEVQTTSFFLEEYKEAIEMVNAIIALCKGKKEEGDRKDGTNRENDSINNRILFVGQRGTGKTSAMTSFAKGLDDAEIGNNKAFYFKHLPMIDPSNFDNNTNILLTVITMMFSEAKELMKENRNDEDIISRRESLLKQFDEVFKSLKAITGSDKPMFTLEGLNEKSRALQMRTGMHNLVKCYIEFYNKVKETNISYLVLLIDDIDMTVSHVPEMLEQLRKYLDLDNLLILMSANLGQLYNEMREHYSKAFKETLNDRNQALSIDVEDLANKYLLKLFPTSRRIRVEHNVNQLLNTLLEIEEDRPKYYNIKLSEVEGAVSNISEREDKRFEGKLGQNVIMEKNPDGKKHNNAKRLQNVILSLIWKKTRLLFAPKDTENVLHPIIPTNLRELMQFLDMLTSLKEVKDSDVEKAPGANPKLFWDLAAYNNCKDNLGKFKSYILHNWIPNHLSVEEELVFENIPTDITEINKHLINAINMIGTNHKKDMMSREVGLDIIERNAENVYIDRDIYTMVSPNDPKFVKANKISDIFNQPSNYSYGDLLLMIDKYETYFESGDDRKFTDAIKIYYTILLFETMFFDSKDVIYQKKNSIDDYELIPIQKLIGGTVYYPNYFEIIKDKYFNQKGPSFDAKRAFYHKLPVDEGKNVGENYPFYAVLYYGDIRPDRYDTKHIYDTTFDNDANIDGTDYVTFDILSILSNMLNPWHTYFRANNKVKDESNEWKNKIEGGETNIESWRNFCKISQAKDKNENTKNDDSDIFIPNSILPFYSVDMMLNYLKESYEVSMIIGKAKYPESLYKEFEKTKIHGRNYLFSKMQTSNNMSAGDKEPEIKSGLIELLKELRIVIIKEYICSLIDNLNLDESKRKRIKTQLSENNNNALKEEIDKLSNPEKAEIKKWIKKCDSSETDINKLLIDMPQEYLPLLEKYIELLALLLEVKLPDKDNKSEDIANYYLNNVISLLLDKYPESQKERDTLIKELHKYFTPSEIFKHLVESLWDNKLTEILIRSNIQQKVRDNDSVDNYYIKLWEKTKRLIDIADDNATDIYLSIFNKAAGIFITTPDNHKNHMKEAGMEIE